MHLKKARTSIEDTPDPKKVDENTLKKKVALEPINYMVTTVKTEHILGQSKLDKLMEKWIKMKDERILNSLFV